MKKLLSFLGLITLSLAPYAQQANRWSLEVNYGLNGNFFVINKDYSDFRLPDGSAEFNRKNFWGTIGGVEVLYTLGKRSTLAGGIALSANLRKVDYSTTVNNVPVFIENFRLAHRNQFYQLSYQYRVTSRKPLLAAEAGIFYLRMQQQELGISTTTPLGISLVEREFQDYKLEELGVFAGLRAGHQLTDRFEAGLRSRLYFVVSAPGLEAITLTPYLRYRF